MSTILLKLFETLVNEPFHLFVESFLALAVIYLVFKTSYKIKKQDKPLSEEVLNYNINKND